jgi:hypothetical protein
MPVTVVIGSTPLRPSKEIEMPPRTAKLAVGGELEAHVLLLLDYRFDLTVLYCF